LDLLIHPDHPFKVFRLHDDEETRPAMRFKPIQAVKVKPPKVSKPIQAVKVSKPIPAVKVKPVTKDPKKAVIKSSLIKHPYHILDWSPFPFLVGLFTFS